MVTLILQPILFVLHNLTLTLLVPFTTLIESFSYSFFFLNVTKALSQLFMNKSLQSRFKSTFGLRPFLRASESSKNLIIMATDRN